MFCWIMRLHRVPGGCAVSPCTVLTFSGALGPTLPPPLPLTLVCSQTESWENQGQHEGCVKMSGSRADSDSDSTDVA